MSSKNRRTTPEKAKDETRSKKAGLSLKLDFKKPELPKIFSRKKQRKNMEDRCTEINDIITKIQMLDEAVTS